jgi:hypothetical protein
MVNTKNILTALAQKDYITADRVFQDAMLARVDEALDQRKEEIAKKRFPSVFEGRERLSEASRALKGWRPCQSEEARQTLSSRGSYRS